MIENYPKYLRAYKIRNFESTCKKIRSVTEKNPLIILVKLLAKLYV